MNERYCCYYAGVAYSFLLSDEDDNDNDDDDGSVECVCVPCVKSTIVHIHLHAQPLSGHSFVCVRPRLSVCVRVCVWYEQLNFTSTELKEKKKEVWRFTANWILSESHGCEWHFNSFNRIQRQSFCHFVALILKCPQEWRKQNVWNRRIWYLNYLLFLKYVLVVQGDLIFQTIYREKTTKIPFHFFFFIKLQNSNGENVRGNTNRTLTTNNTAYNRWKLIGAFQFCRLFMMPTCIRTFMPCAHMRSFLSKRIQTICWHFRFLLTLATVQIQVWISWYVIPLCIVTPHGKSLFNSV